MKKVKNKYIVVIGAARSGVAAACLLHRKGANIFVTDHSSISPLMKERLIRNGIDFEEGGHTDKASKAAFAVLSPGVPTTAPLVQTYLNRGKKVFSEIEAASWFNRSPITAVTGSNGKTTVTRWLGHTWKKARKPCLVGGNIGRAFSDQVEETDPSKAAILEISSFQLDHIDKFHPRVSMLLNITPDHLDRYDNKPEKYAAAKFKISKNQKEEDWFIYYYDDPVIKKHAANLKKKRNAPKILAFSNSTEVPRGAFIRNRNIIMKINDEEEILMPTSEISLNGKHNLNNGLATALAARAGEIKNDVIRESLRTFEGVEHRLEHVRTVNGVKYINDSKATNINAVWYALDSFTAPVVLILGGRDKGNDYTELNDQIKEKVHTIIALGEAQPMIEEQLKSTVPQFETASNLVQAVQLSKKYAKRGEVVLLSPACSSFDMFENYEHRGNEFKQAVNRL